MKKYQIIYADPPWQYNDKSLHRGGAERHYNTMKIDDIINLNIKEITDTNCCLFLWATFPLIKHSFNVITAWGFEYKTCAFVWIKTNKRTNINQTIFLPEHHFDSFWGMGHWTRSNAEICLLAIKGKPKRKSANVHQLIYEPISNHSKKPTSVYNKIINLCGDLNKIELFARKQRSGWDSWGNEINNNIEL